MRAEVAFIMMGIYCWTLTDLASGEPMPTSVQACRSQVDDLQRLRCYDAAVDSSQDKSVTVASGSATPAARPVVKSTEKALAPHEPSVSPGIAATQTVTSMATFNAKVAALSFRPSGAVNVTLDNGQVWTQYGPEGRVPLRTGDSITLRPGLFGAYVLAGPSGWITKVHLISNQPTDRDSN